MSADDWLPSFTWITPWLAIGGHVPCERTEELAREHRVGAVVDLRAERCDDEAVMRQHGIAFLHLPTLDIEAVSPVMLAMGVSFVDRHVTAGARALVHCEHGIGRSTLLALCVLVARGIAPLDALELAKSRRPIVSPSPRQYDGWAAWLRAWKQSHGAAWDVPDMDAFGRIAYRHLRAVP